MFSDLLFLFFFQICICSDHLLCLESEQYSVICLLPLQTDSPLPQSVLSLSLPLLSLSPPPFPCLPPSSAFLSPLHLPCTHIVLNMHDHSEYESNMGSQRLKWRMKGNRLKCESSGFFIEAMVLAEELAYNRSLRQYKMFILERPLDPNFKVCVSLYEFYKYCTRQ